MLASSMAYETVYDMSEAWMEGWVFLVFGAVFIALGAFMVFAPGLSERMLPGGVKGRMRTFVSWGILGFALFWTGTVSALMIPQHLKLQAAAREGTCSMAEGAVENFDPGDANRKPERFTVSGVPFTYSYSSVNGGFNKTSGGGGPLRAGARVRICYVPLDTSDAGDGRNNVILRLEIARAGE